MLTQNEIRLFESILIDCRKQSNECTIMAEKMENHIVKQLFKQNSQLYLALGVITKILLDKEHKPNSNYDIKFRGIK